MPPRVTGQWSAVVSARSFKFIVDEASVGPVIGVAATRGVDCMLQLMMPTARTTTKKSKLKNRLMLMTLLLLNVMSTTMLNMADCAHFNFTGKKSAIFDKRISVLVQRFNSILVH